MRFVLAACVSALLQNGKMKRQPIAAASSSDMSQINLNTPVKENLVEDHYHSANLVNILKSSSPPIR